MYGTISGNDLYVRGVRIELVDSIVFVISFVVGRGLEGRFG